MLGRAHVEVPLMLSSVAEQYRGADEALYHCHPLVRGSPQSFARVLDGHLSFRQATRIVLQSPSIEAFAFPFFLKYASFSAAARSSEWRYHIVPKCRPIENITIKRGFRNRSIYEWWRRS